MKNFSEWNIQKIELHDSWKNSERFIKKRQIWYTQLGVNIGCEQDGGKSFSRPVLVINKIGSLFFVVPLTTKWVSKKSERFYYDIKSVSFESKTSHKTSHVILSQCRVIDKKRFEEHIGTIKEDEFRIIKKLLASMYLEGELFLPPVKEDDPEGHL